MLNGVRPPLLNGSLAKRRQTTTQTDCYLVIEQNPTLTHFSYALFILTRLRLLHGSHGRGRLLVAERAVHALEAGLPEEQQPRFKSVVDTPAEYKSRRFQLVLERKYEKLSSSFGTRTGLTT